MHSTPVRFSWRCGLIALAVAAWPLSCIAATGTPPTAEQCRKVPDKDQRLDCYDHFVDGKVWLPQSTPAVAASENTADPDDSTLHKDWNLTGFHEHHPPAFQPYQLNYLLFGNWSNSPNRQPYSPAHPIAPTESLDSTEVKFQFSIKSQLVGWDSDFLKFLDVDKYRLWFAYTQQSNWQAYNAKNSSPFRDSNYEPELILTFGRSKDATFLESLKLFNIGLEHQSNGDSNPLSRSWNRVYGQADFEFGKFTLYARAWWRIPESHATDDNPDILEYVGRGEIVGRWASDGTSVSLLLRDNLSLNPNRGFAQFDVSLPLFWNRPGREGLSLHFQATTGYGDTLLDYNHRQTTVGVGVALGGGGE